MTIDELLEQPIYTAKSPWKEHRRLSALRDLQGLLDSAMRTDRCYFYDLLVPSQEIGELIEGYAIVIGCNKIKTHTKEFLPLLDEQTRRYYLGNFDVPR